MIALTLIIREIPERDIEDKLVYNLQNKSKIFIDLLDAYLINKLATEKLNDKYYGYIPETEPNYIYTITTQDQVASSRPSH